MESFQEESSLVLFDLMGNKLDISQEDINNRSILFNDPKVVILTYWNEKGQLLNSKKMVLF